MASPDSKIISRIENLDRISQLPELIILNILSHLPSEDAARASILSKAWKSFCSLYPILYFDEKLFALGPLVSSKEGCRGLAINQIRDMFMDYVDCQLSGAMQLVSPIRKIALTVTINDAMYFSRVNKWMKLVQRIYVEDLSIVVQMADFIWDDDIDCLYEFPLAVLASKGLRSVYVRGCKLGCDTCVDDPINKFFSLQQLCLSHVFLDEDALDNLIRFCQGIETLVLDNCPVEIKFLKLSKFPKLKKAVIELQVCELDYVDIVGTNLECIKCDAETELRINAAACAGIRELTFEWCTIKQSNLFEDITATFPLLEEGDFYIHDTHTLKAANNVLRTLKFYSYGPVCVKEVHVDCPNLTLLDCWSIGLAELYVDCPKLRVFNYCGTTVPNRVFCSSMVNLEHTRCNISLYEACNTLWLVNLRAFLILVMGNATSVFLTFTLPMATFEPEQVEAVEVFPLYNVHLSLVLSDEIMQDNIAALVDGLLWVIRPTTLTICCGAYYMVKYLCDNFFMKQEDNSCGEQATYPRWMQQLEDFHVECPLNAQITKKSLAALPEQCVNLNDQVHFKFSWFLKQEGK